MPSSLQDLVRKGIPVHFRGITWQLLCDAHISSDKSKYAEHLKTTSACEKVGSVCYSYDIKWVGK